MKNLTTILIVILLSSPALADLAGNICDPLATQKTLVSDWKKESNGNDLCANAVCRMNGRDIPRELCIREQEPNKENMVSVFYQDFIHDPGVSRMEGKSFRIILNPQDQCFSACEPKKKILGSEAGLKRRTCVECFKARTDLTNYDESFLYPEIGKRLYKGSKCHELCRDKEGPFISPRQLTPACQQCVGVNGLVAEVFEYMITSSGRCFEVDKDNKYRMIDNQFCQNSTELIRTTFEISKSLTELFTGGAGRCLELDDKTYGQIYKISAEMSKCDPSSINNDDRNSVSDRERSSPAVNAPRSGSSQQ